MTDVNFYQCDDTMPRSMAPLLMKVLEEKKKTFIYANDEGQIKEIDGGLWAYGKNKFIPHITISDKEFSDHKSQPVIISNKEDNANDADYLVLTKEVSEEFLKGFSRVFYFYDSLNADAAQRVMQKYKAIASKFTSYRKEGGKWAKD